MPHLGHSHAPTGLLNRRFFFFFRRTPRIKEPGRKNERNQYNINDAKHRVMCGGSLYQEYQAQYPKDNHKRENRTDNDTVMLIRLFPIPKFSKYNPYCFKEVSNRFSSPLYCTIFRDNRSIKRMASIASAFYSGKNNREHPIQNIARSAVTMDNP